MTAATTSTPAPTRRRTGGGAATVWRLEAAKLIRQRRVQGVTAVAILAPFVFVAGLHAQSSVPQDTLFGRWVDTSGFAIPLVVLGFTGQWAFPVLTSIVAGDIFSSEDHFGTWKMVLTRSRSRAEVFVGKVAAATAYSLAIAVVLAGASIAAGLASGTEPLVGLSGQTVGAGHSLALVALSWASTFPAVLTFAALGILLSVVSRNSVVGTGGPLLIGLVLQLVSFIALPEWVQTILPTNAFQTWHGFWTQPGFTGPFVEGVIVSAVWWLLFIGVAVAVFRRRAIAVA